MILIQAKADPDQKETFKNLKYAKHIQKVNAPCATNERHNFLEAKTRENTKFGGWSKQQKETQYLPVPDESSGLRKSHIKELNIIKGGE